jgi:hypothetical protein
VPLVASDFDQKCDQWETLLDGLEILLTDFSANMIDRILIAFPASNPTPAPGCAFRTRLGQNASGWCNDPIISCIIAALIG